MSIASRAFVVVVGGVLAACPSDPVAQDSDTDPSSGTESTGSTDTPGTSAPTTEVPTTGASTGTTGTTTEPETTGTTTSTTEPDTTGTTSTTDAVTSSTGSTTTGTTDASSTTTDTTSTSTTSSTTDSTSTTDPIPPTCGDGVVDPGEDCDQPASDLDDSCLPDCTFAPGAGLPPLDMKTLLDDDLRWQHVVPNWYLDASALMIGRATWDFGPDQQVADESFMVMLPGGDKSPDWVHNYWAEQYGRIPLKSIPLSGTDALVAGLVYTEAVMPGSGGYLYLASIQADGTLAWVKDYPSLPIATTDMTLNINGEIALVGNHAAGGKQAWALRLASDGSIVWQKEAPQTVDWTTRWRGVVMDGDDVLYAVGERHAEGQPVDELALTALAGDGAPIFSAIFPSPTHMHALPSDIVLTSDNMLAVAMSQFDADVLEDSVLGVALFELSGSNNAWTQWAPDDGWSLRSGAMLETYDGGVFIGGVEHQGGQTRTRVTRFDASVELQWARKTPGGEVRDLDLGPPADTLYVLTPTAIRPHFPY